MGGPLVSPSSLWREVHCRPEAAETWAPLCLRLLSHRQAHRLGQKTTRYGASRPSSRPFVPGCHSRISVMNGVVRTNRWACRAPAARMASKASMMRTSLLRVEITSMTEHSTCYSASSRRNNPGRNRPQTIGFQAQGRDVRLLHERRHLPTELMDLIVGAGGIML